MPCKSDDYRELTDYTTPLENKIKALKKRNNDLTKMLCTACKKLKNTSNIPPSIQKWWDEHQIVDAKRIKQEKAKKRRTSQARQKREAEQLLRDEARKKLTTRERKLLGVK